MFSLEKCREFLPKKYQTDQHVQKLEQVLRFIGQSKNDGRYFSFFTCDYLLSIAN